MKEYGVKILKIDHLGIAVKSIDEGKNFWTDVLGLEFLRNPISNSCCHTHFCLFSSLVCVCFVHSSYHRFVVVSRLFSRRLPGSIVCLVGENNHVLARW